MRSAGHCSPNCSPPRLALVAIRAALVTLTALALVSAAAGPIYGQTPTSPPRSTAEPPAMLPASAGRVVLRNARFDSVRVEVRVGPAADCGQNVLVGVASLPRRSAWGITTDAPVCYRREEAQSSDQAAGPPGSAVVKAWTAWTRRVLARGQRVEEQL